MIKWSPFQYRGTTYDLSHLHPFQMTVSQPATQNKPERHYKIQVFFSLHCFTKSKKGEINVDKDLICSDNREDRIFDFKRYELSKNLRNIVQKIGQKRCLHTGHGNYFIIEILNEQQEKIQYEVYFKLSRGKKLLNLYIESAYPRSNDAAHKSGHKKKKPIRFTVLAYNIQVGKKIKVPK